MKNTFPTCLPLHLSPGSSNNLIAKRFSSFEKKTISSRDSISFSHTSSHLVNFSNDFFLPNGFYCGDASCHPVLTKGRSCSKTRCHTPIHWQKARNQTQKFSLIEVSSRKSKVPNCHFTIYTAGQAGSISLLNLFEPQDWEPENSDKSRQRQVFIHEFKQIGVAYIFLSKSSKEAS